MEMSARIATLKPETWVAHPIDLDVGEVAGGCHLIARSISLSATYLLFEFAFVPEPAEGADVWLNTCYGADLPVSWNYVGAGDDVQYERPPPAARYAWFDFSRPGRRGSRREQPVGERLDVPGSGAAASADEPCPAVGPGGRVLEVLAGREAVEYPVRRLPAAVLGVRPDGPGVAAADDIDRVQGHPGVGVHHG